MPGFYTKSPIPQPSKRIRTQRQIISSNRNLHHGRIDGCIQNLTNILLHSMRSGGLVKYDPKLEFVRQQLHAVVESAYNLQCKLHSLKQPQKKPLDKVRGS